MKAIRILNKPIISNEYFKELGGNINGPSIIEIPEWISNRLARYYLYFAHHNGEYIRLAYSDYIEGPWRIYEPGTLQIENSLFYGHIASPDVHIDNKNKQIRMYYHGYESPIFAEPTAEELIDPNLSRGIRGRGTQQLTRVSISEDGVNFTPQPEIIGNSYFRVFYYQDYHYAIGMPGILYRSKNGITNFEKGPSLFTPEMRHCALKLDKNVLTVFYTNAFDCPEQIYFSKIELGNDWLTWKESESFVILKPEMEYEGADMPMVPSARGAIMDKVNQLRDPAYFKTNDKEYLFYCVAGEQGIAIAELI
jgi:hypothetical protein